MPTCRRLQIELYLSPCTKLKPKCTKHLSINVTVATLNLIEEKVGSSLEHIGTGDHFLNKQQEHSHGEQKSIHGTSV